MPRQLIVMKKRLLTAIHNELFCSNENFRSNVHFSTSRKCFAAIRLVDTAGATSRSCSFFLSQPFEHSLKYSFLFLNIFISEILLSSASPHYCLQQRKSLPQSRSLGNRTRQFKSRTGDIFSPRSATFHSRHLSIC